MLHCNEAGNGYPVVLLHGFCENNTCFDKQVLLLKGRYTVICPDVPGSGRSPVQPGATMESMADALYETLLKKGIRKCVLIGHSMGGYITLEFARKYARLLDGFGLLHSVATPDDEERKQKRVQAQKLIVEKGVAFYTRSFVPPMFKPGAPPDLVDAFIQDAASFDGDGLISQLEAMKNRKDNTDVLKQTGLPVFFGVGKYDSLIPEDKMLAQALLCRQSYVAYLEESGHMGHVEEDRLTASHIGHFTEGVRSLSHPDED